MMKSNVRHTQHKGLAITIRWTELGRGVSWGPVGHRFTASYLIAAQGAEYRTWHHFPQHVFVSFDTAAAYALAQAQRDIDTSAGPDARADAPQASRVVQADQPSVASAAND
jgi:hypothetical protein